MWYDILIAVVISSLVTFGCWYFWASLTANLLDCKIKDLYSWIWKPFIKKVGEK